MMLQRAKAQDIQLLTSLVSEKVRFRGSYLPKKIQLANISYTTVENGYKT